MVKKSRFLASAFFLLSVAVKLTGQPPVEVPLSSSVQMVGEQAYFFHPVRQGQTLYSIARAYGVEQTLIVDANPDVAHGLRADQIIRIPAFIHVVAPQETVFGLSAKYGLEMERLRALNPVLYKEGLQIGQSLVIPGGRKSTEPDPVLATAPAAPERQSDRTGQETPPSEGFLFLPEPKKAKKPVQTPECEEAIHLDQYHVALLIPLFLDEMAAFLEETSEALASLPGQAYDYNLLPPNHTSFSFASYYQGVLVALDSIRKQGLDVVLHVHDVCQDIQKANELILENKLSAMDLIIGPFFRSPLEQVAAYALQHDIPVVSPLHADKTQLNNFPNLYKVTPAMDVMLNNLAAYIAATYPDDHILLVHNNQPQARPLISGFIDNLKTDIHHVSHYRDSLNLARVNGYFLDGALVGNRMINLPVMNEGLAQRTLDMDRTMQGMPPNVSVVVHGNAGIGGVYQKMDKGKRNILVTLIGGEAFVSNYLRELSLDTLGYDMMVVGIPDWERYQNVEIDYLQNLNVHIFTPDFYDYGDSHVRNFVRTYRDRFKTEPDSDALKAGQTAWFFFDALMRYGLSWPDCIHVLNDQGTQSPFNFRRTIGDAHGWENTHSTIYLYKDFQLFDVKKRKAGKQNMVSEGQ